MYASPLLDAMIALYYVARRETYPQLRDAFRAGYEAVRPWVEQEPGELDRLLVARGLDLMNLIAGDDELDIGDWGAFVDRTATLARWAMGSGQPGGRR